MSRNTKFKILALSIASLIVAAAFVGTSCKNFQNLALPTAVHITANPDVTVPVMATDTKKMDLASKISALMGGLAGDENSSFHLYSLRHDDKDDALRFLLAMNMNFPIDTGTGGFSLDDMKGKLGQGFDYGYEKWDSDGEGHKKGELKKDANGNYILTDLFTMPTLPLDIAAKEIAISESTFLGALKPLTFPSALDTVNDFDTESVGGYLDFSIDLCTSPNSAEGYFSSLGFGANGELRLTFDKIEASSAVISEIEIKNGSTSLSKITENIDLTQADSADRTATFPMNGKELPRVFSIYIKMKVTGKTSGGLGVTPGVSGLTSVKGFTKDDLNVSFPSMDPIDLGTTAFTQTTFADGSKFELGLKWMQGETQIEQPAKLTFDTLRVKITQDALTDEGLVAAGYADGLQIVDGSVGADLKSGSVSLKDKFLNTNQIEFDGEIVASANNATIPLPLKIVIAPKLTVSKFARVIVPKDTIAGGLDSIPDINEDIGSIAANLKKAYFGSQGFGLKVTIDNQLPLDLTLGIYSQLMRLGADAGHPMTYEFEMGKKDSFEYVTKSYNSQENSLEFTGSTHLDASIEVGLDSETVGGTDYLVLNDIELNESFKLGLIAEPILDVKEAYVILPDDLNDKMKGSFPADGSDPIDLSTIGKIFGADVCLSGAQTYVYIDDCGMLSTGLRMKMNAKYTPSDAEDGDPKKEVSFFKNPDANGFDNVTFQSVVSIDDAMVKDAEEKVLYVQKDLDKSGTASVKSGIFEQVLKDSPKDFGLDYAIHLSQNPDNGMWFDLSGVLENVEESEGGDEGSGLNVGIGLYIDLPVQLTVKKNDKGYGALDIMKIVKSFQGAGEGEGEGSTEEKDLLGRSAEGEDSILKTLTDYIEKVGITVNYSNYTGMEMGLVILDENTKGEKFSKEIILAQGNGLTQDISLATEDFEYIKNTIPFNPDKIEVRLPGSKTEDTKYTLKRDLGLELVLIANVKGKVDYTLNFGGSNEGGQE